MVLGSDGEVDLCLNDAEHSFKFDRAFTPQNTQEDVFAEVSQFVQSAVDGYNVSLFAYGQTGSGKTHTMFGTGPDVGIIPRSMDQILVAVAQQQEQGWSFELEASFIEIYQETVRDLLCCEKDREGKQYQCVVDAGCSLRPSVLHLRPTWCRQGRLAERVRCVEHLCTHGSGVAAAVECGASHRRKPCRPAGRKGVREIRREGHGEKSS